MKSLSFVAMLLVLSACAEKAATPPSTPTPAVPVEVKAPVPKTTPEKPAKTTENPSGKDEKRTPHPKSPGKHTVTGFVEHVLVGPQSISMKARIDTGAQTSSINADIIKIFKRDEKRRVLFSIDDEEEGKKLIFESRLVRYVRIKSKEGKLIRRPVVFMDICLAGQRVKGEVNLAERNHMNYPMLVGRNMLADRFVVNPSVRYATKPECNTAKESEE